MTFDSLILGILYICCFFGLFFIGKLVYSLLHKNYNLNTELVENDNPAVSLAVTGYYAGLVLSIGAAVAGPSHGLAADLVDILIYGLLGIGLQNCSVFICSKIILYRFDADQELLRDRNQGAGAVFLGVSIASGFVVFGSVSGTGGSALTAIVFWVIGQGLLILAALVYNLITPYNIHDEIEKDNVAAGISCSGALIAIGIVVGLAAEGDFVSWGENLPGFITYSVIGLISLPLVRFLTDKLLLPGVKLSDEILGIKADKSIEDRGPNTGAAYIEAFAYIAGAFMIYWCI